MKRLLALLLVAATACASSDKNLVADSTAAYMVWESDYEDVCVEQEGPPSCHDWQERLSNLYRTVKVTNEAQKIGKLPPEFRARLKALQAGAKGP